MFTIYPAVVCTIPFGFPVEPEVYKINNGSSASITSGSQVVSALSNNGCSHSSRPSFMVMSASVRLVTSTVFTPSQDSNALSTIPFKSIVFFPRKEPSAVITILQSESLIRVANAFEENPANTTECIAPIRAQAKREMANSGIIGT